MINKYIDMHTHTNHSDGSSTVENSLKKAEQLGLSIISISDHNNISAYDEIEKNNIRSLYNGEIVPGVEITTTYNGEIIEILGYGFDIQKMRKLLGENVYSFYDKQIAESKLNLSTFKKYGIYFSPEFEKKMIEHPEELFDPNKTSSRKSFLDEMKKHSQNCKFFDNEEQMKNISLRDFTRNMVYNPKSNLYVNQSPLYPSLNSTINMIHQADGLAFLAHLYEYSPTIEESLEDIATNYQLDGIECYYATFTKEQSNFLETFCKKYNLYKSCGSDFHGYEVKPNNHMGLATEGKKMDISIISDWIYKVNNKLRPISSRQKFAKSIKSNSKFNINNIKKKIEGESKQGIEL